MISDHALARTLQACGALSTMRLVFHISIYFYAKTLFSIEGKFSFSISLPIHRSFSYKLHPLKLIAAMMSF